MDRQSIKSRLLFKNIHALLGGNVLKTRSDSDRGKRRPLTGNDTDIALYLRRGDIVEGCAKWERALLYVRDEIFQT